MKKLKFNLPGKELTKDQMKGISGASQDCTLSCSNGPTYTIQGSCAYRDYIDYAENTNAYYYEQQCILNANYMFCCDWKTVGTIFYT